MAVAVFRMQNYVAEVCGKAEERWSSPGLLSKVETVVMLVWARFISGVCVGADLASSIALCPKRLLRVLFIPMVGNFSLDSFARSGIVAAVTVASVAGRIFVSLAGTVSPEITYQFLKMDRLMLALGLLEKAQALRIPNERAFHNFPRGVVDSQRWRWDAAREAMINVSEALLRGDPLNDNRFVEAVWKPAIERALSRVLGEVHVVENMCLMVAGSHVISGPMVFYGIDNIVQ